MNKGILTSLMSIALAFAAIIGGTLAWFTDSAGIEANTFTAGTVKIEADESWEEGFSIDNWNPGDCTDKVITLEVTGSKRVFVRLRITEMWEDAEGAGGDDSVACETHTRDIGNVNWWVGGQEWPGTPAQWQMLAVDGVTYWYYKGMLDPAEVEGPDKITVLSRVCLELDGTDNSYQGAEYSLSMEFDAVQVTHDAVESEWGVSWDGSEWIGGDEEEPPPPEDIFFADLAIGDYIYIRNNSGVDVLFQKIGTDRVLLRGTTGSTRTQANAINDGIDYENGFPAAVRSSSRLLTKEEVPQFAVSILDIDVDWWTSSWETVWLFFTRRYYVNTDGALANTTSSPSYYVRPSMFLQPNLTVTGGDGTAGNPYVLIIP